MGWLSSIFSTSTIDKAVDAVISTGDKLAYTEEEKADMRLTVGKLHIDMLKAYEPFKIAQRILAVWFSGLFGLAFIFGLATVSYNMIHTYIKMQDGVLKKDIIVISLQPLFDLISAFNISVIVLAIVAFYFAGGSINSFRGNK